MAELIVDALVAMGSLVLVVGSLAVILGLIHLVKNHFHKK